MFKPDQHLNVSLSVLVWFVLTQQLGFVGSPVGLQVFSVLSDVGPGPHVIDASNVDLQDAVEGISPPGRTTNTPQNSQTYKLGFETM